MQTPQSILKPFKPDEYILLELLCPHAKPNVLWFISEADYGEGSSKYLEVLERIQREKRISKLPFDVALSEVVSLTQWHQPEPITSDNHNQAMRINLAIAFSCTILLTVNSEWYYNRDGENSTVIRLLQVSRVLSTVLPDLWESVGSLLAWRVTENETDITELPFFLYGLLLSGLQGKLADESELLALADYLIAEEGRCRAELQDLGYFRTNSSWLLGLTNFNQLEDDWRDTAGWLREGSERVRLPELRNRLLQIANWLTHYPH